MIAGAKPTPEDDSKTLPRPEAEKKLGSSPDGLTQGEAQKRLLPTTSVVPAWP